VQLLSLVYSIANRSFELVRPQTRAAVALLALTLSPSLISARPSTNSLATGSRLSYTLSALFASVGDSGVFAQNAPAGGAGVSNSSTTACGWSSQCPQTAPCCSEFGYCSRSSKSSSSRSRDSRLTSKLGNFENSGLACTAGCNPQGSFGQGYCAPTPVCQSGNVSTALRSRSEPDIDPILSFSRISVHLRRHIKDSARPLEMGR